MAFSAGPNLWQAQLSELIAQRIGLHFPPERWPDLERGLTAAATELGCADSASCGHLLLAGSLTQTQLQILASHLTIGETYFFRDQKTFDVLAESILPELIRQRRSAGRRLRFWSAACCTGEEAYSLAILLRQIIPDFSDWHITILATDINPRFLQKAGAGIYGEWSFREVAPAFKERHFRLLGGGRYELLPEIRKLVTFAYLNLVEDAYPALATDTNAMDLIFCRNALMYFTLPQARKVLRNLHHALVPGGWLAASPNDGAQATSVDFVPVNFPGVILHRKSGPKKAPSGDELFADSAAVNGLENLVLTPDGPNSRPEAEPAPLLSRDASAVPESAPPPMKVAEALYEEGRYADAVAILQTSFTSEASNERGVFSLLARALANQGQLPEALKWCDRWVALDKLEPASHYLRAVVLQELGHYEETRRALQRTLYLQPDFVLAHFALGNLARSSGTSAEVEKHFSNALHFLRDYQPGDLLPQSDGLTAGRLREILSSLEVLQASR